MTRESIGGAVKELAGDAESALGDAIGDHGAQIGGRLRTAEARGERMLAGARESAGQAAEEARGLAADAYRRGEHAVRAGGEAVAEQVGARPLAALLVAGLIGYGLGLLMHNRR
ncbi:hypothetical protein [Methylobacterium oxalidis]|uniref:hypothetical protein n=1 Tax=Methylobacterium oxalidis TaxID=944322 RepID=UPI0033158BAF